ncbi:MAG: hypothetical protein J5I93_27355 [Pirellulaceae bacterium]|nr:hypothetical protein [Pirellulaceae bacterium]
MRSCCPALFLLLTTIGLLSAHSNLAAQDLPAPPPAAPRDLLRILDVVPIELQREVTLEGAIDQVARPADLTALVGLATPVAKTRDAIHNPNAHWTVYHLDQEAREPVRLAIVETAYGTQLLTLGQPRLLFVPTERTSLTPRPVAGGTEAPAAVPPASSPPAQLPAPPSAAPPSAELPSPAPPQPAGGGPMLRPASLQQPVPETESASDQPGAPAAGEAAPLDHYKVYEVIEQRCVKPLGKKVDLCGWHLKEPGVTLMMPRYLAVPVAKTHADQRHEILRGDELLAIYETDCNPQCSGAAEASDQFGRHLLSLCDTDLLAVPATARFVPPPTGLDHFLLENLDPVKVEHTIRLQGLFDLESREATVNWLSHLGTSVRVSGFERLDPAARLTTYIIEQEFPDPVRTVRVWNEFGEQELYLGRPIHLLVPAREQGAAAGSQLDHYKCYLVLRSCCGGPHAVSVTDPDGVDRTVAVTIPKLYCVPVTKTREGVVEEQKTPRNHLVLYGITHRNRTAQTNVEDQFGAQQVTLRTGVLLGVPSLLLNTFPPIPKPPAAAEVPGEQSVSLEGEN